jgi:nitrogen-specific signal transduction histidine kinase
MLQLPSFPQRTTDRSESSPTGRDDVPLAVGLLFVIGLVNLYLYTTPVAANARDPGSVAPHAFYGLVVVAALYGSPWGVVAVWAMTALSVFVFASVHSEWTSLMMNAVVFAPASGVTALVIRRLRVAHAAYARSLRDLDAANADARKRLAEFAALFDISRMAGLTFDLEALFRASMERISRGLQMYRGTLAIFDAASQELKVKYAYGLTPREIAAGRYRLGEGIYGRVFASGEPMAVPNLGDEPLSLNVTDEASEALSMRTRSVAFLCIPIKMEGATVGVLSVDRAPVDRRTLGDDLNFLTILASLFGQALKIQQMIEATVQQERLAVLGKIARSVAHEVRNPLGGIRGAAQLLQLGVDDSDRDTSEYARVIVEEVDRLNRVVEQLLHFGDARPGALQKHDLREILERVLFLTSDTIEASGVVVIRDFDSRLPEVQADGDRLTQVFLNLVRNALDAMPKGGTLRLSATTAARESRGAQIGEVVRTVEVSVCDTGEGVPPHLREEVFNPFYTTKQKGTGIGLALTRRLVEEHRGYIEVQDNTPRGACFKVTLPSIVAESVVDSGEA